MGTIFVSIACFMDSDILNTIEDCLNKAKYPENIVFGVCLQYDPEDNFFSKYDNHPQVKIKKIHWKEARGPAFARGIIYDLFTNEDYFFQIDCHTRFFNHWDDKLIHCYHLCEKINNKCIISHYPININDMSKEDKLNTIVNISTVRCVDKDLGIKTHGRFIDIKDRAPTLSWGISAAMLFISKNTILEVPFDKNIYHGLQFEEQVVMAARYWTRGYDIFSPIEHIISTEYITNTKRYSERPPIDQKLKTETYQRLTHVLKLNYSPIFNDNHYLGHIRSIEDYYKMLGIYDKVKQVFTNHYLDDDCTSTPLNTYPKILILILSSDGVYDETNDLSKKTWLSNIGHFENMQYYFYYGKNKYGTKDPHKIFTDNDENRSNILKKTIDVFKFVNENEDYDYILRLCACSYVDLNKLHNFVKTLDKKKIFSGPFNTTSASADIRYNLSREPFITGANLLLSKDVVDFVVKNEKLLDYEKYGHADDLNISIIINNHYLKQSQWIHQTWINISDTDITYCKNMKNNTFYHYHYNHRIFKTKLLEFHNNYCS